MQLLKKTVQVLWWLKDYESEVELWIKKKSPLVGGGGGGGMQGVGEE